MAYINIPRKLSVVVHCLGLSSLAAALFLQSTVFTSILRTGYFSGVEQNHFILSGEIVLTGFAMSYLGYMVVRFIWSNM